MGGEPVQFLNCRAGPMQILWDFVHRVSLPWCEDHLSRKTCEMRGYAKSDCRKFFVRNFFIQQLLLPLQPTVKRKQNKQEEGEIERKRQQQHIFVELNTSYTGNNETFKICLLIILFRKCPDRNLFKGCLAFPTGVKWQTAKYYSSLTLAGCCQTIEKTLKSWQIWLGITTFRLFVSLWPSIFQLQYQMVKHFQNCLAMDAIANWSATI